MTNQGPLIDGTELRSLGIITGLTGQNYCLTQLVQDKKGQTANTTTEQKIHLAIENALLTASGGILAWASCLFYGACKCKFLC